MHPSDQPTPRAVSVKDLAIPAHVIALGFGSGLSKVAPGTCGTLWAWLVYAVLLSHLNDTAMVVLLIVSLLVGWWACKKTSDALGVPDSGHIVWDEVLGFWLVLWLLGPSGFWMQLAAFAVFRFFDAVKPQPVKWADQSFKGTGWKGAWGIIFDDLVAAFCTLLVFAIVKHFFF